MRLFLLLFSCLLLPVFAFPQAERGKDLNLKELYHPRQVPLTNVNDILQDGHDFVWLGGREGLVRYDGNSYKKYFHQNGEENSLPETRINSLFLDRKKRLWIITRNLKLCRYRVETDDFITYPYYQDGEQSIMLQAAKLMEHEGQLWLAGFTGIFKFNEEKDQFEWAFPQAPSLDFLNEIKVCELRFLKENVLAALSKEKGIFLIDLIKNNVYEGKEFRTINKYKSILGKPIYKAFCEKESTDLWVATKNGLGKYEIENDSWSYYNFSRLGLVAGEGLCQDIQVLQDGRLLVGLVHGGIAEYDDEKNVFLPVQMSIVQSQSLDKPTVKSIFQDKGGVVWISIAQGEVYYSHPFLNQFRILSSDENFPMGEVIDFEEFSDDQLMVGIDGGGVVQIDLVANQVQHTFNKANKRLPGNGVTSILPLDAHTFWVSVWGHGIQEFTFDGPRRLASSSNSSILEDIPIRNIKNMKMLGKDSVFMGSRDHGVNIYNQLTGELTKLVLSSVLPTPPVQLQYGNDVYISPTGDWWVRTSHHGAFRKTAGQLTYYSSSTPNSISNQALNEILIYDEKLTLFGSNSGLDIFNAHTEQFLHLGPEEGLPGRIVRSLIVDQKRRIWLYTDEGLSQIALSYVGDSVELIVENTYGNILPEHGSGRSTSYLGKKGHIFFGGVNGMFYFHPDSLSINSFVPTVVISDVEPLATAHPFTFDTTQKIELASHQSMVKINFAALSYLLPEDNSYSYKMEGLDEEWRDVGPESQAIYTYLPSGTYTFKVRAANNHGIWNEVPAQVNIVVELPLWRRPWAILLYILFTVSAIIVLTRWLRERRLLRKEKHKLETENEVEKARLQLFTDISQEFRTPLSLIKGPIEEIKTLELTPNLTSQIEFVSRNVDRLSQLTNQLLDIRNLQTGQVKLMVGEGDLVADINQMIKEFQYLAQEKNVNIRFLTVYDSLIGWFDKQIITYTLFNLLSHSFKDVQELGEIMVELKAIKEREGTATDIEIAIRNDGKGIDESEIKSLFERQTLSKGIGLALTKQLIKLHQGSIYVESGEGNGTIFYIKFPFERKAYSLAAMATKDEQNPQQFHSTFSPVLQSLGTVDLSSDPSTSPSNLSRLVLAVKDHDYRLYLQEKLTNHFEVASFENGMNAWEDIENELPELLITDIDLPAIDGFTLCKQLKGSIESFQVPVILLTSLSSKEFRMRMLDSGADYYFEKPFDVEELVSRSQILVLQHQKMIQKYSERPPLSKRTKKAQSMEDLSFLTRLQECMEENVSNQEFTIDALAKSMKISRVHLYRRVKEITGMSASAFFREYQMKQAEKMLLEGEKSIAEIGFAVGYSSPSHFSRTFKSYSGYSPRAYVRQNKE